MKNWSSVITVIAALFLLTPTDAVVSAKPQANRAPRQQSAKDDSFTVSGTLVAEDGSPIPGIWVMIAEAKGSGYVIRTGKHGEFENPNAHTDAKGTFSVKVKRSLFKENQEFTVLASFYGQLERVQIKGAPTVVKIDKTTKGYKLGTITRAR